MGSRSSSESKFHRNAFFHYSVKHMRGILVKRVMKLPLTVAHDLIIVDLGLTYFCVYCEALNFAVSDLNHLGAKYNWALSCVLFP